MKGLSFWSEPFFFPPLQELLEFWKNLEVFPLKRADPRLPLEATVRIPEGAVLCGWRAGPGRAAVLQQSRTRPHHQKVFKDDPPFSERRGVESFLSAFPVVHHWC